MPAWGGVLNFVSTFSSPKIGLENIDKIGMSGHSHWAGIKRKKGATDEKRGRVFSKLLIAISVAAKGEPNPDFNPRLRDAILKAKENSVPAENIERAVKRASESAEALEELVMEAYGPGGVAILIEAATDSRNRTVAEVKKILSDNEGKWAEPGSVLWTFELSADRRELDAGQRGNPSTSLGASADSPEKWRAKFPQEISADEKTKLNALVEALEEHDDVQNVYTNVQ